MTSPVLKDGAWLRTSENRTGFAHRNLTRGSGVGCCLPDIVRPWRAAVLRKRHFIEGFSAQNPNGLMKKHWRICSFISLSLGGLQGAAALGTAETTKSIAGSAFCICVNHEKSHSSD
ncbi:hypothetical protein [Comamonas sp. 26]|uniref:hypothetical protein n=1 Tax=Comamonas sp. 26 TaxID=2035201 RepID=UPI00119823C4|nr:hypothetical protein [Comamonas sp. 26]